MLDDAVRAAERHGHTAVHLPVEGRAEAVVALGDSLRSGGYRTIDHLRRLGPRPVLASGHSEAAARSVAERPGIAEAHARMTPEGRARLVRTARRPPRAPWPAAPVVRGPQPP
ncbi:hypothetical protein ABZS86_10640 [Streptomyces sp. NPDC005355]|uniref:hypothetical protein n=1 Tax=Streptomyces sp. NPDC005355 TaxID=3157038 RepID=UPI0033A1C638